MVHWLQIKSINTAISFSHPNNSLNLQKFRPFLYFIFLFICITVNYYGFIFLLPELSGLAINPFHNTDVILHAYDFEYFSWISGDRSNQCFTYQKHTAFLITSRSNMYFYSILSVKRAVPWLSVVIISRCQVIYFLSPWCNHNEHNNKSWTIWTLINNNIVTVQ